MSVVTAGACPTGDGQKGVALRAERQDAMFDFNRVSLCGRTSSDKENSARQIYALVGALASIWYSMSLSCSECNNVLNSHPPHNSIEQTLRQLIFRIIFKHCQRRSGHVGHRSVFASGKLRNCSWAPWNLPCALHCTSTGTLEVSSATSTALWHCSLCTMAIPTFHNDCNVGVGWYPFGKSMFQLQDLTFWGL